MELDAYQESAYITGLEDQTVYEYRVGSVCGLNTSFNNSFENGTTNAYSYSNIQQFTTDSSDKDNNYQCGLLPDSNITNQSPLQELLVANEIFTAGDFPVTVISAQGSNGNFTGEGYIVVPYLGNTKLKVVFNSIQINTERQLIGGVIETTYDPNETEVYEVDVIKSVGDLLNDLITILSKKNPTDEDQNKFEEIWKQLEFYQENLDEINMTDEDRKKFEQLKSSSFIASTKERTDEEKQQAIEIAQESQKLYEKYKDEFDKTGNLSEVKNNLLGLLKDKNVEEFIFSAQCWFKSEVYRTVYFYGKREGNKLTIKEKSFKEEELLKLTGIKDLTKKSHFLVYKADKKWQLLTTKEEKLRTNECPVQNADAKPKDIQQIYDAFSKLTENDYFGLSKEDFNNLKDNLDVLQASLRKNQQAEIEKWVGDKLKVFAKVNGKVVEVEKPLTDKQIDNGDWTDTSIDSKIRYTFDKGVIQVKAFGFRKDLIITNCKTADLITIASDIKSKTNKFLSENKVDNYRKEGSFESDEAFADGKKIEVKGKFVKIISEGIGLTTILLKTGQIEKPTYSDTSQATIKAPGLVTGSFEVVAQKVTDITSLATLVYDVAVEEEVRTALKTQFREIKDQIGEDSKEFFPILGEVAVTVLSGNNLEEWKKTVNSTDFGERSHLTTRGIGNTIVSAMSGVALAKNLPEITEKLGEAVKKSKKVIKTFVHNPFDQLGKLKKKYKI